MKYLCFSSIIYGMNAKKKGNAGENKWANWLKEQGITAYRNSSSGANYQKSDVHNSIGANFEVKTVKKLNLKEAWKQSSRDAFNSHTTPYLIIHFDGMGEDEWLVVMDNWNWVDLQLKAMAGEGVEIKPAPSEERNNRELKWAVQNLKNAAAKVDKLLSCTE